MNDLSMWTTPLQLWDEWAMSIFYAIIALSTFLYLNALGRGWHHVVEKAVVYTVFFGAGGAMLGPFCRIYSLPSLFELTFTCGVAAFAVFLTRHCWMEIPLFDRRGNRSQSHIDVPMERRGRATEEEDEEHACFH